MGLENPIHLMMVLMVMLLVFGAKRLPEMGRSLGDGLRGFKDAISGNAPPEQLDNRPVVVSDPNPAAVRTVSATPVTGNEEDQR